MTQQTIPTELRFEGDLSLWLGILLAALATVLVYFLYRRETQGRSEKLAFLLPILRCIAIALIVMMLTGPVLRGSINVADMSRVLVFVDASESMTLTDEAMSIDRKMLNARRLGWVDESSVDTSLYDAANLLSSVTAPEDPGQASESLLQFQRYIYSAVDSMEPGDPFRNRITRGVADPLEQVAADHRTGDLNDQQLFEQLQRIAGVAKRLQIDFEKEYRQRTSEASPSDTKLDEATERLDEMTRWKRAEAALLDGSSPLLESLNADHHVDLIAISDNSNDDATSRLWQPLKQPELPSTFDPFKPIGESTDLATKIDKIVGELPSGNSNVDGGEGSPQLSVVILTDGQHNEQRKDTITPMHLARLLGRRGIPVYPVGFGSASPPPDLAVLAVQTPEAVFADDRVKGKLVVKDNMPAGSPLQLRIEVDGQQVWSDQLTTDSSNLRDVEFDFPIKQLVENRMAGSLRDVAAVSLPLSLKVTAEPLEGEIRDDNNTREASVRAITRPRSVLLVDSRPRWEFRYLRNLLERDEHWFVNDIMIDQVDGRMRMPRGESTGSFPNSLKRLFTYDVIVIGDVPAGVFRDEELQWIHQFVGSNGGGLLFLDGQRGKQRSFASSELKSLLPIQWKKGRGMWKPKLSLTPRGMSTPALAFSGDSDESTLKWNMLPSPRWMAEVEALPGCEALVQGDSGPRGPKNPPKQGPGLVVRRYGAGTVLYSGFDESWRWRFEVGDEYHAAYWNQIISFVMESPFAIHDRYVSIDTGGFSYQPGDAADIKIRIRDENGQPIVNAVADVQLYQDGEVVATLPLVGGMESGGVFRAQTQPLQPGAYQVGVTSSALNAASKDVRAEFIVFGEASGELDVLYCHEALLRQMAEKSGGQYLREEDIGRLPEILASEASRKEKTRELVVWRSWYWFVPLIGLFTMEWLIRKRLGMM